MATNLSVPRDNNNVPLIQSYAAGVSGTKTTSATAGTPVAIVAASRPCRAVAVYAYTTNSDTVAVGMDTGLVAESSAGTKTGKGEQLTQGASTYIYATDAANVYLVSAANGDGVSFVIYT